MKSSLLRFLNNKGALLFVASLSTLMLSPKWFLTGALWLSTFFTLRYFRKVKVKGFILGWILLSFVTIIAQVDVMPMPIGMIIPILVIANLFGLIPFILDRWALKRLKASTNDHIGIQAASLLVFPIFSVIFQMLFDKGPQGTWGNPIYTQYHFSSFIQLASITGIYGMNFMVAWFATTVDYTIDSLIKDRKSKIALLPFCTVMVGILVFGFTRLSSDDRDRDKVTIGTIALDNTSILEAAYFIETGEIIDIPKNAKFSDHRIAQASNGLMKLVSDPTDPDLEAVQIEIDKLFDEYILESKKAIMEGAKIIAWSEAAIIDVKSQETTKQELVAQFADANDVYLFYPTAVFLSDRVESSEQFIENKILTFGPNGQLLNTYFKNIPVPGVEASVPGDGKMPIIETPYGKLTPAICYDLDFPDLIAQTGDNGTDLIVAPTGDWYAISPYHTYQSAFRCIENGTNMMKAVNGGLSAIINSRGQIESQSSYYEAGPSLIVADVSTQSISTLHSKFRMLLTILFQFFFFLIILGLFIIETKSFLLGRKSRRKNNTVNKVAHA